MFGRFTMNEKNYSKVPVFENGLAQPVFPLTDGKTGEKYDPATSSIVKNIIRLILQILTKKWMRMFRRDVSVQWIFL